MNKLVSFPLHCNPSNAFFKILRLSGVSLLYLAVVPCSTGNINNLCNGIPQWINRFSFYSIVVILRWLMIFSRALQLQYLRRSWNSWISWNRARSQGLESPLTTADEKRWSHYVQISPWTCPSNAFISFQKWRPSRMYLLCLSFDSKHILIECPDFELSRQKYFNCNTLPDLFEKTPEANIMTYLKEIGLYSKF